MVGQRRFRAHGPSHEDYKPAVGHERVLGKPRHRVLEASAVRQTLAGTGIRAGQPCVMMMHDAGKPCMQLSTAIAFTGGPPRDCSVQLLPIVQRTCVRQR